MKYHKPKKKYVKKEGSRFVLPEGLNPYVEVNRYKSNEQVPSIRTKSR